MSDTDLRNLVDTLTDIEMRAVLYGLITSDSDTVTSRIDAVLDFTRKGN